MTVLAVDGTALFRHRPTGVDRYARGLLTALAQARPDWEIVIARWRTPDPAPFPLVLSGRARVVESPLPREAYRVAELARVPVPVDLVRRTHADVWLFPDFVRLPLLHQAPSVTVVHDLSFRIEERFSHRMHRSFLERQVARATRHSQVATVSSFVRDQIELAYGLPDVPVVRPGLDLVRFRPTDPAATRTRLGLDRPYVLTVGELHARKNLVRLIEAFALLGDLVAGTDLVLAGGAGAHSGEVLGAIAGYTGPGRIRHLGYVDDADLPAIYSGALLTAMPSVYEGFGIPVLEAMACGSPVVAAGGGALEEASGSAAILVGARDTEDISRGLRLVLADPVTAQALRDKGSAHAARSGWDTSAEEMATLLERTSAVRATA